jgi:hypothetical protein
LLRGPEDLAPLGRRAAIDDKSETASIASVLESFQTGKPLTWKQVFDMLHKEYNSRLTKRWLHTFIGRYLDQIRVCRSLPQEDARLIVPRVYVESHIVLMRMHIMGRFSWMVFNLDEVGSSDWDDSKPRIVLAPVTVSAGEAFHSVSRRYRYVTLLTCVSAAGDALTPMIISQTPVRDS